MAGRGHKKTDSGDETESAAIEALNRSIEINVGDGFANGALVQHGLLIDQPGHQGGGADLVNAARNALGVFKDTLEGIVGEERAGLVACDVGLMFDIADGLL